MLKTEWSGSLKGMITFEDGLFALAFDVGEEDEESLYEFTKEICEYRLQGYFERRER